MLVGGVIRDPVHNDLDAAPVGARKQVVKVLEGPEDRVDIGVVRDVLAEVRHRRPVKR